MSKHSKKEIAFEILRDAGRAMNMDEILEAHSLRGVETTRPALSVRLSSDGRLRRVKRGVFELATPAAAEEVLEETERIWTETTEGLRTEGVMPPEIAQVLFGRGDPYAPPAPPAVLKTNGLRPVAPEMPAARVSTAGESAKLKPLAWLLAHINGLVVSLKQLTGTDLESVTVNAVDHERLKRLAQSGADGLSQFEALLDTAAQFHAQ